MYLLESFDQGRIVGPLSRIVSKPLILSLVSKMFGIFLKEHFSRCRRQNRMLKWNFFRGLFATEQRLATNSRFVVYQQNFTSLV